MLSAIWEHNVTTNKIFTTETQRYEELTQSVTLNVNEGSLLYYEILRFTQNDYVS